MRAGSHRAVTHSKGAGHCHWQKLKGSRKALLRGEGKAGVEWSPGDLGGTRWVHYASQHPVAVIG